MSLNCDCYGGCWGDHSVNWPRIVFRTDAGADNAFKAAWKYAKIPLGSYVRVGLVIRLETQAYKDKLLAVLPHE